MVRPLRVPVDIPLATPLFLTGRASLKTPPPHPAKEQTIILQKRLLVLQDTQNETQRKLDKQTAVIKDLSTRRKRPDDRPAADPPASRTVQEHTATKHPSSAKRA
jgi:hypothetical protein